MRWDAIYGNDGPPAMGPLSPLMFCAGIAPIIESMEEQDDAPNKDTWYLDHGAFCGALMAVGSACTYLNSHLPTIGLHLNDSESEVYYDGSEVLPDKLSSLPQIQGHATRSYLGAPLHPDESTAMLSTVHKMPQVAEP